MKVATPMPKHAKDSKTGEPLPEVPPLAVKEVSDGAAAKNG